VDDWFVEREPIHSWEQPWFQTWTRRADREIYGPGTTLENFGKILKDTYSTVIKQQLMEESPLLDLIDQPWDDHEAHMREHRAYMRSHKVEPRNSRCDD
jgi:hypothetical protein